jgi:hypothetical protein
MLSASKTSFGPITPLELAHSNPKDLFLYSISSIIPVLPTQRGFIRIMRSKYT